MQIQAVFYQYMDSCLTFHIYLAAVSLAFVSGWLPVCCNMQRFQFVNAAYSAVYVKIRLDAWEIEESTAQVRIDLI